MTQPAGADQQPVKRKRGRPPLSNEERLQRQADRATRREGGETPTRNRKGISRDIRLQVLTALNFVGGVDFLVKQALKPNNTAFMALLGKCLVQEDGAGDGGLRITVQQINITQAQQVPGVINSPIAGHIAAPAVAIELTGEIVDMEEVAGDG